MEDKNKISLKHAINGIRKTTRRLELYCSSGNRPKAIMDDLQGYKYLLRSEDPQLNCKNFSITMIKAKRNQFKNSLDVIKHLKENHKWVGSD